MFKEFKEFAMKGNVVDMAVGIIIGAAFGAIVNSLVTDIVMPLVGARRPAASTSPSRYRAAQGRRCRPDPTRRRRGQGGRRRRR